ncbi:MAG TPA: chemotaxis protein CheB [Acidimicrobiales bacterium]|nr:chemotaxis protein CheB [Acidimicrobiales bacterium]
MTRAGADERPAGWADVAVVGASAGGVGVLQDLVRRLPTDLGLAVLVVLHLPTTGVSVLSEILNRATALHVVRGEDGMHLSRGVVVVAPTDHHMLVDGAALRLSRGALVNGHRPAVDPTLETAARSYGRHTLGVLLSGTLDDGVVGLGTVQTAGGLTAVQDPVEAPYPGMPQAAVDAGVVDHVLSTRGLADLIVTAGGDERAPLEPHDEEHLLVLDEVAAPGVVSSFTCPNCGGALWERQRNGVVTFECRVGHRYSPASLFEVQGTALDDALWAAHRALLERADLARRMARRMRRSSLGAPAGKYDRTAEDAERRASIVHEALMLSRQGQETDQPDEAVSDEPDGARR